MSKPNDEDVRLELVERVKRIALTLGLRWDGHGGAIREQLGDGRSVWRVHDEWGNTGGSAVIDPSSADLLSIEETPPERDPPAPALPVRLVPEDSELIDFARTKLDRIGWTLPDDMVVARDESKHIWRLSAARSEVTLCVEIKGRRGNLHIVRASRE